MQATVKELDHKEKPDKKGNTSRSKQHKEIWKQIFQVSLCGASYRPWPCPAAKQNTNQTKSTINHLPASHKPPPPHLVQGPGSESEAGEGQGGTGERRDGAEAHVPPRTWSPAVWGVYCAAHLGALVFSVIPVALSLAPRASKGFPLGHGKATGPSVERPLGPCGVEGLHIKNI